MAALPHLTIDPADAEDLARRLAQAQQAVRARDDFLAVAAHELRSPMNALGLQLAALERSLPDDADPRLKAQVQRARRGVARYLRRATVLLDVSRALSGELQPGVQRVDAASLVADVADDFREEAQLRGTSIDTEVRGNPTGLWDAHMIEEVLANLVSNALKYGEGSPVRVAAVEQDDGWVWLSVSDGGPGIPRAWRERIFEKFERAVGHDRHHGGFGLGLWIVARMVAAHEGSISVDTGPRGGSEFVVRLPQDKTVPVAAEERRK